MYVRESHKYKKKIKHKIIDTADVSCNKQLN